jgi:hypothetical protein
MQAQCLKILHVLSLGIQKICNTVNTFMTQNFLFPKISHWVFMLIPIFFNLQFLKWKWIFGAPQMGSISMQGELQELCQEEDLSSRALTMQALQIFPQDCLLS